MSILIFFSRLQSGKLKWMSGVSVTCFYSKKRWTNSLLLLSVLLCFIFKDSGLHLVVSDFVLNRQRRICLFHALSSQYAPEISITQILLTV